MRQRATGLVSTAGIWLPLASLACTDASPRTDPDAPATDQGPRDDARLDAALVSDSCLPMGFAPPEDAGLAECGFVYPSASRVQYSDTASIRVHVELIPGVETRAKVGTHELREVALDSDGYGDVTLQLRPGHNNLVLVAQRDGDDFCHDTIIVVVDQTPPAVYFNEPHNPVSTVRERVVHLQGGALDVSTFICDYDFAQFPGGFRPPGVRQVGSLFFGTVELVEGENRFVVTAADQLGQVSMPASVSITYVP